MDKLVEGFSSKDREKIVLHLTKLFLHLTPQKFVIVGGLAIRYHLKNAGIDYPKRPFNDIDIVVENIDVVHPDVIQSFLVYHFHQKNDSFFFAFVDEATKTKVDIFDDQQFPSHTIEVPFGSETVYVISKESQFAKTVYDIQRISEERKVDPKQFSDTELLSRIVDMNVADELWQRIRDPKHPRSILDAIQRANMIRQQHPEWIQKSPFRKSEPYHCEECIESDTFPLDSMERIYNLLGYVE
ncbi:MAG TPA: hypothetical protein VLG69_03390 [Candidatus Andersenbacteria bacterium]|nr:hypothetical protein [Candidatus Andersenbacteria bacterium]